MESKSLDDVYKEYIAKYSEPVDIGKFTKYIKRNYNSHWKYQDIRKIVKSHQTSNSTSTTTITNDDKRSVTAQSDSIKKNKVNYSQTSKSSKTKSTKPKHKANLKVKAQAKRKAKEGKEKPTPKPKTKTKTKTKTKSKAKRRNGKKSKSAKKSLTTHDDKIKKVPGSIGTSPNIRNSTTDNVSDTGAQMEKDYNWMIDVNITPSVNVDCKTNSFF